MNITVKVKAEEIKQLSKDLPKFIPEAAESYWDEIEIHPVKEIENGDCETSKEGDEDFWSIYLHQLRGGVKCVADLKTKQQAKKLAKLIENATNYRVYSKSH